MSQHQPPNSPNPSTASRDEAHTDIGPKLNRSYDTELAKSYLQNPDRTIREWAVNALASKKEGLTEVIASISKTPVGERAFLISMLEHYGPQHSNQIAPAMLTFLKESGKAYLSEFKKSDPHEFPVPNEAHIAAMYLERFGGTDAAHVFAKFALGTYSGLTFLGLAGLGKVKVDLLTAQGIGRDIADWLQLHPKLEKLSGDHHRALTHLGVQSDGKLAPEARHARDVLHAVASFTGYEIVINQKHRGVLKEIQNDNGLSLGLWLTKSTGDLFFPSRIVNQISIAGHNLTIGTSAQAETNAVKPQIESPKQGFFSALKKILKRD